jgi:hypothetical protein
MIVALDHVCDLLHVLPETRIRCRNASQELHVSEFNDGHADGTSFADCGGLPKFVSHSPKWTRSDIESFSTKTSERYPPDSHRRVLFEASGHMPRRTLEKGQGASDRIGSFGWTSRPSAFRFNVHPAVLPLTKRHERQRRGDEARSALVGTK